MPRAARKTPPDHLRPHQFDVAPERHPQFSKALEGRKTSGRDTPTSMPETEVEPRVALAPLTLNILLLGGGIAAVGFLLRSQLPWLGGTTLAIVVGAILLADWQIAMWLAEDEVKKTIKNLLQRRRTTLILTVVLIAASGGILFAAHLCPAHGPALRLLPYGATLASYLPKPDSRATGLPTPQLELTIGDRRYAFNDVKRKALYVGRGESRVKWVVTNEDSERRNRSMRELLGVPADDDGASALIGLWLTEPPDVRDGFVAAGDAISASLHVSGQPPIALSVTPSTVTSTKDIVNVLMEIK
jgi:hypothetical protein